MDRGSYAAAQDRKRQPRRPRSTTPRPNNAQAKNTITKTGTSEFMAAVLKAQMQSKENSLPDRQENLQPSPLFADDPALKPTRRPQTVPPPRRGGTRIGVPAGLFADNPKKENAPHVCLSEAYKKHHHALDRGMTRLVLECCGIDALDFDPSTVKVLQRKALGDYYQTTTGTNSAAAMKWRTRGSETFSAVSNEEWANTLAVPPLGRSTISRGLPPSVAYQLTTLLLGGNTLTSLHGLQQCPNLVSLDVSGNNIRTFDAATSALKSLRCLKEVDLSRNPVTMLPHYRAHIICHLSPTSRPQPLQRFASTCPCPNLTHLDRKEIGGEAEREQSHRTVEHEEAALLGMLQQELLAMQLEACQRRILLHREMARYMIQLGYHLPPSSDPASLAFGGVSLRDELLPLHHEEQESELGDQRKPGVRRVRIYGEPAAIVIPSRLRSMTDLRYFQRAVRKDREALARQKPQQEEAPDEVVVLSEVEGEAPSGRRQLLKGGEGLSMQRLERMLRLSVDGFVWLTPKPLVLQSIRECVASVKHTLTSPRATADGAAVEDDDDFLWSEAFAETAVALQNKVMELFIGLEYVYALLPGGPAANGSHLYAEDQFTVLMPLSGNQRVVKGTERRSAPPSQINSSCNASTESLTTRLIFAPGLRTPNQRSRILEQWYRWYERAEDFCKEQDEFFEAEEQERQRWLRQRAERQSFDELQRRKRLFGAPSPVLATGKPQQRQPRRNPEVKENKVDDAAKDPLQRAQGGAPPPNRKHSPTERKKDAGQLKESAPQSSRPSALAAAPTLREQQLMQIIGHLKGKLEEYRKANDDLADAAVTSSRCSSAVPTPPSAAAVAREEGEGVVPPPPRSVSPHLSEGRASSERTPQSSVAGPSSKHSTHSSEGEAALRQRMLNTLSEIEPRPPLVNPHPHAVFAITAENCDRIAIETMKAELNRQTNITAELEAEIRRLQSEVEGRDASLLQSNEELRTLQSELERVLEASKLEADESQRTLDESLAQQETRLRTEFAVKLAKQQPRFAAQPKLAPRQDCSTNTEQPGDATAVDEEGSAQLLALQNALDESYEIADDAWRQKTQLSTLQRWKSQVSLFKASRAARAMCRRLRQEKVLRTILERWHSVARFEEKQRRRSQMATLKQWQQRSNVSQQRSREQSRVDDTIARAESALRTWQHRALVNATDGTSPLRLALCVSEDLGDCELSKQIILRRWKGRFRLRRMLTTNKNVGEETRDDAGQQQEDFSSIDDMEEDHVPRCLQNQPIQQINDDGSLLAAERDQHQSGGIAEDNEADGNRTAEGDEARSTRRWMFYARQQQRVKSAAVVPTHGDEAEPSTFDTDANEHRELGQIKSSGVFGLRDVVLQDADDSSASTHRWLQKDPDGLQQHAADDATPLPSQQLKALMLANVVVVPPAPQLEPHRSPTADARRKRILIESRRLVLQSIASLALMARKGTTARYFSTWRRWFAQRRSAGHQALLVPQPPSFVMFATAKVSEEGGTTTSSSLMRLHHVGEDQHTLSGTATAGTGSTQPTSILSPLQRSRELGMEDVGDDVPNALDATATSGAGLMNGSRPSIVIPKSQTSYTDTFQGRDDASEEDDEGDKDLESKPQRQRQEHLDTILLIQQLHDLGQRVATLETDKDQLQALLCERDAAAHDWRAQHATASEEALAANLLVERLSRDLCRLRSENLRLEEKAVFIDLTRNEQPSSNFSSSNVKLSRQQAVAQSSYLDLSNATANDEEDVRMDSVIRVVPPYAQSNDDDDVERSISATFHHYQSHHQSSSAHSLDKSNVSLDNSQLVHEAQALLRPAETARLRLAERERKAFVGDV